MTFLELVKELCDECGISATGPSTVLNQTGDFKRAVRWITRAWQRIEGLQPDWDWLRTSFSFITVDGQAVYPLGTGAGTVGVTRANFRSWINNSFTYYTTSVGIRSEVPILDFIDYSEWQRFYNIGVLKTTNVPPMQVAIGPNDEIVFSGPTPAGYTITGDYFKKATPMVLDADVPGIPDADKHVIIVYRAMMFYGAAYSAPEVYQEGETEYKKILSELKIECLPEIEFA